MTRKEIVVMKADAHMDLLILNLLVKITGKGFPPMCGFPPYTTEVWAAWQVIEAMVTKGYYYIMWGGGEGKGHHCEFDHEFWAVRDEVLDFESPSCDTLPLAICKGALIAIMDDEEGSKIEF